MVEELSASNRAHRAHVVVTAGPAGSYYTPSATTEAEINRYTKAGVNQDTIRDIKPPSTFTVRGSNLNFYTAPIPNYNYANQNPPDTMIGPGKSSNWIAREHKPVDTNQNFMYGNSNLHRAHIPVKAPVVRTHPWTHITNSGAFSTGK